ncbi:MAG TPA: glycoside hydrolase family 3 N-terminal domain-containing protein [Chloroflexota bacterium]|nr:glycoside hydrolase family 3 N-terminal domain-containing protein [Chloroflexota bacterium]
MQAGVRALVFVMPVVVCVAMLAPVAAGTAAQGNNLVPDPDVWLQGLSTSDRVAQLFMVTFSGSTAADAQTAIGDLHVGAIVLLANAVDAPDVTRLTQALQDLAQVDGVLPLLIANNHEGGSVQPIRGQVSSLGSNWEVGQIQPLSDAVAAACVRGATHGRELAAMGINTDLAPVLDVLDNPNNTVIGDRAYSSDPQVVASLGSAYIEAMQAQGVLAVGKHFPGHGSTSEDSHLTLPFDTHSRSVIEARELLPFRAALQANVTGILVAHVNYPALDLFPSRPASLSPAIVTDLLRGELGFDGLVMTDDLGLMRAITDRFETGDAAVQAVLAGADMLIVVGSAGSQRRAVQAVADAVDQGTISADRLRSAARHVLMAKQRAGLLGSPRRGMATATPVCSAG